MMSIVKTSSYLQLDETSFAYNLAGDQKIVLITSDYMSYTKYPTEIASLLGNNLHIEQMEGFREDKFSLEYVQNIAQWESISNADFLILTSTLGYTKKFIAERIMPKMSMPVPYTFTSMRGYPAFLIGANGDDDYISITHAGRVARIRVNDMSLLESRPIAIPLKGNLISTLSAKAEDELLVVTKSGYAKRVTVDSIPYITEMNTNGDKLMQRSNPIFAGIIDPTAHYVALTNQRMIDIDTTQIPLLNVDKTDHKLARLKKQEFIITIFTR